MDKTHPIFATYLQAKVTIYGAAGYADTGTVIFLDDHWIEIMNDGGDRFLFPTTGIRLIKLIKSAPTTKESQTLLRAYIGDDIEK